MALEIGSRLGHYEVTALIGEGGIGQVYRATDTVRMRFQRVPSVGDYACVRAPANVW